MNYTFPVITHADQILTAIADSKNFVVKNCGEYSIVQYVLNGPDTFPDISPKGDSVEDLVAKLRRECRGIAFCNTTGKVISRPFHKFFNYGERAETVLSDIPPGSIALEKLDGSMIRPIPVGESFRLATKMGTTDVAMQAEEFIADRPYYGEYIESCMVLGLTPIFEWCSRKNQIILEYPEDKLTLLAVRDNESGDYLTRDILKKDSEAFGIPLVERVYFNPTAGFEEKLSRVNALEQDEGVVFILPDGHMLKVKTEWYVRLHRSKELVSREKDLVKLILEDKLDDVKPILTESDLKAVNLFEMQFKEGLDKTFYKLTSTFNWVFNKIDPSTWTRKDFAAEVLKLEPQYRPFMFQMLDDKPVWDLMKAVILRGCSSRTTLEEVRWIFNAKYKGWADGKGT